LKTAYKLVIAGLVQGVGFRPFIHRLAEQYKLAGYVKNIGGSEVEVYIEGSVESVYGFLASLWLDKPPPAIIEEVYGEEAEPESYTGFEIKPSSVSALTRSNIPPDFAVCRDCLREVLTPGDRRYRYPFNSCAWCGPRYSYMYRVPYDRVNTAMAKYKLCGDCEREYMDLGNTRRYHAEGISCSRDGPELKLYTASWELVEAEDPIKEAAKLVDEGYIVAVKGIGGFHIAALATDDSVVIKLRERKKRPSKPFAVMGLNTRVLEKLVYMDERDRELLESPQAPILLLPKKPDTPVSKHVSPGLSHEGVFIAYTPLHYLLLMHTRDKFLVMTSGNIHGEPMCTTDECVKAKLKGVVDYVLTHDREIVNRVDDSVIRKTYGSYVLLRRSRGYAPMWIRVARDLGGEYVAFGADLANAATLGFEDKVVLTQYIGDLDSADAQADLLKYVEFLASSYHLDYSKAVVVVDKHPRYHSRRLGYEYAEKHGLPVIEVQHHYAHVMAGVLEAGLEGLVAGLAVDGLGWGDDDTIWGGEVIVASADKPSYTRAASLKPIPLTSDRDAVYPLRLVVSILASMKYKWSEVERVLKTIGAGSGNVAEYEAVYKLVERGSYTPASSTGRLLDAVSALLGVCRFRSYEGEPAVKLEAVADCGVNTIDLPGFKLVSENGLLRLDYAGAFQWLLENFGKTSIGDLALSFLYSLGWWYGELLAESVKGLRVENTVVVSGGAAANTYIVAGFRNRLALEGFHVYIPEKVPVGDGGIGFGQVAAASLMVSERGV